MTQPSRLVEDIDAPISAPEGCLSTEAHEVAFTARATARDALAVSVQDLVQSEIERESSDPDTLATLVAALAKLDAESTKARRAAHACAVERESNVILARLDRNKRALKTSGQQRAPLRVVQGGG